MIKWKKIADGLICFIYDFNQNVTFLNLIEPICPQSKYIIHKWTIILHEHKIHIGLDSIHGFDENNDELLKEIFREAQSLIANYFQQKLIAKEWYLARKDEWKLIKQQRSLNNTMDSM
ncbi:hypothetical protein QQG55_1595 [Brugia pahangi]